MQFPMKRSLLTVLLLGPIMLLLTVQAAAFSFVKHDKGIAGSGHLETRVIEVDSFHKIDIGGAFDLQVRLGKEQKVQVTIDDNLWDIFQAKVKKGELQLDWDESCRPDRDCRIEIVLPALDEISIHGAGDVDIEDFKGDSFSYYLSGAGELTMDGQVDELKIRVSGAGEADTRELKARSVDVVVSGAGNARVYASEAIKARVSGVGKIRYYGDPQDTDTQVSGIGSIKGR